MSKQNTFSEIQVNHLKRLKNNSNYIKNVGDKHLSHEFLLAAVKQDRHVLSYLEKDLDESFSAKCLKACKWSFQYLKKKNYKLCLDAVKLARTNIAYVPKELISYEIAELAFDINNDDYVNDELLKYIPAALKDYSLCLKAVTCNGLNLQYVPKKFHTPELLTAAVKENGNVLEFVENQTEELCVLAFTDDTYPIEFVKNKTYAVYLKAVASRVELKEVPIEFRTPELCRVAVAVRGKDIRYVPKQTRELCLLAVKKDAASLEDCIFRDEEIYLEAFKKNGRLIKLVTYPTKEMIKVAVTKNPSAIEDINPELIDSKICELALSKADKYDRSIDSIVRLNKNQTLKFCEMALNKREESWRYITLVTASSFEECQIKIKMKQI